MLCRLGPWEQGAYGSSCPAAAGKGNGKVWDTVCCLQAGRLTGSGGGHASCHRVVACCIPVRPACGPSIASPHLDMCPTANSQQLVVVQAPVLYRGAGLSVPSDSNQVAIPNPSIHCPGQLPGCLQRCAMRSWS